MRALVSILVGVLIALGIVGVITGLGLGADAALNWLVPRAAALHWSMGVWGAVILFSGVVVLGVAALVALSGEG